MTQLLKKCWIGLAIVIITLAIISSIFRALTPWARQYKGEVESHLSTLLGKPVTIDVMETGWYWFEPVIKLQQVTVHDSQKDNLHLDQLLVGINLWKSIWQWQIQPGILAIENVQLDLRETAGRWQVQGFEDRQQGQTLDATLTKPLIAWLADQQKLMLKQISLRLHFSNGAVIPIENLELLINRRGERYQLRGDASLSQTDPTRFKILGDIYFDPDDLDDTQGELYFDVHHLLLAQWQNFYSLPGIDIHGGRANVQLWLDWQAGRIAKAQAQLKAKLLSWHLQASNQDQLVQSLSANLAYIPTATGFDLNIDALKMRSGQIRWPENQIQLRFEQENQTWLLFVKKLNLQALLGMALPWPASIKELSHRQAHAMLAETQVKWQAGQLQYVLSRFTEAGWQGEGRVPGVNHLSGALHWQPDQGKLELDGKNTLVSFAGFPAQTFNELNGDIEWKELSHGWRISLDRLVLQHPELTLTAQGLMDEVKADDWGRIHLRADFAATNLHIWLPYLPTQSLKPKLAEWLQHDLTRIAKGNGHLEVSGRLTDFPFDSTPGNFSLVGQYSGVDLLITSKWRPIKELAGTIRVNKRDFSTDILHGDIQGGSISQMNLNIRDIGHDRELLLLDGRVQGEANQLQDFILHSPLDKRLAALHMVDIRDLIQLTLRLQVPLFPGKEEILARGTLDFNDNRLTFTHDLGQIKLQELNGKLSFDEHGITESQLQATAWGYPLTIKVQSLRVPKPSTTVHIKGELSVSDLQKQFNAPWLVLLQGDIAAETEIRLTEDPNDLDELHLSTTLHSLAINLPAPLGKLKGQDRPLQLDMAFNTRNQVKMRLNYANRASADLLFAKQGKGFKLSQGQIRLGSQYARRGTQPGLQLAGYLNQFDLADWRKALKVLPQDSAKPDLLGGLSQVDLTIGKAKLAGQVFSGLRILARLLANHHWSIQLHQTKINGNLDYHPDTNSLSGHLSRLHLLRQPTAGSADSLALRPNQLPAINVQIDDLKVNQWDLGQLVIKGKTLKDQWLLEYGRLQTPEYQLLMTGDWRNNHKENQTDWQLRGKFTQLEKILQRLDIDPVVEADHGEINFRGNWPGSYLDFNLAKAKGDFYLYVKDGRVTHLSKETEQKLGLGRLLSILSLQTIPRRLKLDFSDLSEKGYSFDVFKGTFSLGHGTMSTTDSYIDGPVAYASMRGQLDLLKKLYALDLKITPHITASLPVVATIAGGPVAGIAAWIASKIINQGMQKISGYTYKISGPWHDPVIQQVKIYKQKRNG